MKGTKKIKKEILKRNQVKDNKGKINEYIELDFDMDINSFWESMDQ